MTGNDGRLIYGKTQERRTNVFIHGWLGKTAKEAEATSAVGLRKGSVGLDLSSVLFSSPPWRCRWEQECLVFDLRESPASSVT